MFLEIKGIKKSFGAGESHVDVLKGIDLEIESGPQRHLPDNHITYSAGIVSLFLI